MRSSHTATPGILSALIQINRLDVRRPGVRDIFLKYGTTDFYEKVQRICGEG